MTMTTEWNTWFGPSSTPLFGTLHGPSDSLARGGVVLCPPLGKEHIDTYRGMRLLAQDLASLGFLVLRFDYLGTGDSSGSERSPRAVEEWQESIRHAAEYLRKTGLDSVSLVGLRVGALLAASAVERCGPLSSLVLWDPVVAGRAFVRQQRAFYSMSLGDNIPGIDSVSIVGAEFAPEAVEELAALTLKTSLSSLTEATPVLAAAREEMLEQRSLSSVIAESGADVLPVTDHEAFVTPFSFLVRIPSMNISAIAQWMSDKLPAERHRFEIDQQLSVSMSSPDGSTLTETIERLGKHQLFAIRTTSDSSISRADAATVLNSTANEHRIGAGRMWVTMARTLPRHGISVLRYDRRGTGDTGVVLHDEHIAIYSAESEEDLLVAAHAAEVAPTNLVLGGLCSGAWNSARAALMVNARAVVLVNNIIWSTKRRKSFEGQVDPAELEQIGKTSSGEPGLRYKLKDVLRGHLPYVGWRLLGTRGITQVPEVLLSALAKQGTKTTIILSPADHDWFVSQRGNEGLTRLERSNWSGTLSVSEYGDHSAYHRDMRNHLLRTMASSIVGEFGGRPIDPMAAPTDASKEFAAVRELHTVDAGERVCSS